MVSSEKIKLVFRRELADSEMIHLNPSEPDVIPDSVAQILENSESEDEHASQVSRFFNSKGCAYKPAFIPIYVYGERQSPIAAGAHQGSFGEAFYSVTLKS